MTQSPRNANLPYAVGNDENVMAKMRLLRVFLEYISIQKPLGFSKCANLFDKLAIDNVELSSYNIIIKKRQNDRSGRFSLGLFMEMGCSTA